MHGDKLLMVHFSEPEMHPTEGSSKRHKWQVRTWGTRPGDAKGGMGAEARISSIQSLSSTPFLDLVSPFFPAPGPHLPFPTVKPTVISTPTSIQAFIIEFRRKG